MKIKAVNIRELTHHFADYLRTVKKGERIVVMERNVPVADLVPHHEHLVPPGWRRNIRRISLKGEPLSKTVSRNRSDKP
jgi:prevent-host-death family protein